MVRNSGRASHIGDLGRGFERHVVHHGSMPEVQKPDLVCVRILDDYPKKYIAQKALAGVENRWSWKPKTEFEKTYFGDLQEPFQQPTKSALQSSRERLHEIFEHNRYLRRKFFEDVPQESPAQRRGQIAKSAGFGSSETITSQSNQSAESSNGRKSRTDFSSTPDKTKDDRSNDSAFTELHSSDSDSKNFESKCQDDGFGSILWDDASKAFLVKGQYSRKSLVRQRGSLPNLDSGRNSIARVSVDGSTLDLTSKLMSPGNNDCLVDVAVRGHHDEPSRGVVTLMESDNDDEQQRCNVVRGSRSLLELSKSPINAHFSRRERHWNKSCSDLSIAADLRSPRMVNDCKNSLTDLSRCASDSVAAGSSGTCSPLLDRRKSSSGLALSSLYGPLPYSQYQPPNLSFSVVSTYGRVSRRVTFFFSLSSACVSVLASNFCGICEVC